jgi:hypothetical protein
MSSEGNEEGTTLDADKAALQQYWAEKLKEFEETIYPVFHALGYSKNTALQAYMMDELDSALVIATATRSK